MTHFPSSCPYSFIPEVDDDDVDADMITCERRWTDALVIVDAVDGAGGKNP